MEYAEEYDFISREEMGELAKKPLGIILNEDQIPLTVALLRIILLSSEPITPADRTVYTYLYYKCDFGMLKVFQDDELVNLELNWFANVNLLEMARALNMTLDDVEESIDRLKGLIVEKASKNREKSAWNRCFHFTRFDDESLVAQYPWTESLLYYVDLEEKYKRFEMIAKEKLIKLLHCIFEAVKTEKYSAEAAFLLILTSVLSTEFKVNFENQPIISTIFGCSLNDLKKVMGGDEKYQKAHQELCIGHNYRPILLESKIGYAVDDKGNVVNLGDDTICFILAKDWLKSYITPEAHEEALQYIQTPEAKEKVKKFIGDYNDESN